MVDVITAAAHKVLNMMKILQSENGGYPSYRSKTKSMQYPEEFTTPFFNSFALDGLVELRNILTSSESQKEIKAIGDKLTVFLLSNAEPNGLFRFFGPSTHLPPDIDDTSCVWSALLRYSSLFQGQSKNAIHRIKDQSDISGAYKTWFLNEEHDGRVQNNDIDIHVNTNTAYFLAVAECDVQTICQFILQKSSGDALVENEIYYPGESILLAGFIARVLCFTESGFSGRCDLERSLVNFEDKLMRLLWNDGENYSALHIAAAALAGTALASFDYNRIDRWELAVLHSLNILYTKIDSCTLIIPMFPGQPGLYYGSPAATLGMIALAVGAWYRLTKNRFSFHHFRRSKLVLSYEDRLKIQDLSQHESKRADEWLYHYPTDLIVEVTNRCNLTCPVCVSGKNDLRRERRDLDIYLYKKLIEEIGNNLLNIALFNYGEPFLHPEFIEIIHISKQTDAFVLTCTNGMFLSDSNCNGIIDAGLDQIIISLDGTSDESIRAYRGANASYATIVEGIRLLVSTRNKRNSNTPKIVLQMIYMKSTQSLCDDFFALARELGVDEAFTKAVIVDLSNQDIAWNILPDDKEKWHRYIANNGIIEHIGSIPDSCIYLYNHLTVLADGRVVPCCYDGRGEIVFGDLNNTTISEIWNGDIIREFRRNFKVKAQSLLMCSMCPTDKLDSIKVSDLCERSNNN